MPSALPLPRSLARSTVVYALAEIGRDQALEDAKARAVDAAVAAGALRSSVEIVDVEDVPLAYLPGNATRVRVKAVGELHIGGAQDAA